MCREGEGDHHYVNPLLHLDRYMCVSLTFEVPGLLPWYAVCRVHSVNHALSLIAGVSHQCHILWQHLPHNLQEIQQILWPSGNIDSLLSSPTLFSGYMYFYPNIWCYWDRIIADQNFYFSISKWYAFTVPFFLDYTPSVVRDYSVKTCLHYYSPHMVESMNQCEF